MIVYELYLTVYRVMQMYAFEESASMLQMLVLTHSVLFELIPLSFSSNLSL